MEGQFVTTHWSVVLRAGPNDSAGATLAWEYLARTYWYPIYAHVRRRGIPAEESQDLVQEFFEVLLRRGSLLNVSPDKGRFRTFLLSAANHFLSDQFHREHAQKRGGHLAIVSFDAMEAEERYRLEPLMTVGPDEEFDRRWAAALMERALARLEQEQEREGRMEKFLVLKQYLGREVESGEYEAISGKLGMTANAIAAWVRRLRMRVRVLALEEVAQTTSNRADGEDELRRLFD